ncbi:GtrA family protein [Streptomyces antarcticus]|uniref:GtrA family protein n=1 Tax=Streptomyces antarcticus TaxID=2996458 RepID=UPI002271A289|nr:MULTISPECIES: GtrA family protein [unclassified Streptomyces]MCY0944370.1 GtrA family protein [Streptomyces sp. H34-AA3]MCY0948825.1 GtrA family protein [Streptomyces sp. H27-S2]MCZ4082954.1 GtrA family protein [Streptomyces sp. H34-S5]
MSRREQLGQILRFGLVGAVNTGTFYLLYLLLHPWMPYFAAYTLAFLLSMVGSFFMNTYFTYRTRPTWKKFLLFPLTNVTNYVVQSVGLYALVTWAGLGTRIAPLVAAVVAIPFTYLISRKILVPGTARDEEAEAQPVPAGPAGATGATGATGSADRAGEGGQGGHGGQSGHGGQGGPSRV